MIPVRLTSPVTVVWCSPAVVGRVAFGGQAFSNHKRGSWGRREQETRGRTSAAPPPPRLTGHDALALSPRPFALDNDRTHARALIAWAPVTYCTACPQLPDFTLHRPARREPENLSVSPFLSAEPGFPFNSLHPPYHRCLCCWIGWQSQKKGHGVHRLIEQVPPSVLLDSSVTFLIKAAMPKKSVYPTGWGWGGDGRE